MRRLVVFLFPLVLVFSLPAEAQIDPSLLAGLKARPIGPAGMSGRIAAIEGAPSDPNVIYVGATTGGVWKSVDAGNRWEPVFDDQPVHAIGAIAIHPSNPDLVWVGTGEGNLRNSVSVGNGIYRSLDGGKTWTHLGLDESERIYRIRLDPRNPDVAYAAVIGKLWGDSPMRGVYKTVDGGKSWTRILYGNERTGCGDLDMDPRNPDRLIAALYEFRRTPSFFTSGGYGSGLYLTLDGGRTWKHLTEEDGLPSGKLGRIGVAFAPSDPKIVYAWVEAKKDAILRSADGGFTWKNTGAERGFGGRPFYYADLRVDPERANRVYSLASTVTVSNDSGKSWETLIGWSKLHPDHHAMWIDPRDGRHILEGNDGGVGVSFDRGESWRFVGNLPLAQFYHVRVDLDVPYHVYGGLQDNGSWRGPSAVWETGGIRNHHWEEVGFGDGFDTSPYPKDSMQGYAMSQEGYLIRWDLRTGERRSIRPVAGPGDTLRFNWNTGFAQDPFDDDTIYYGSQYLHRSTDRGDTWTRISPDLTTDDPSWQRQTKSGGLTPDVTGAENATTLIAIAPSPVTRDLLWVGTDDGRLHVTRDGGKSWTSLEGKVRGVPKGTWIPHIEASPHEAGTAFVVFDNHRRSDMKPYVAKTTNFGGSWRSLVTPELEGYCLAIEQDPVDPDLLFLGTEFGLYVSLDGGSRWMRWEHGIPTASVMDLVVHPRDHDLVVGTHGRSIYILDDVRPLRALEARILAEPLHLFAIPAAQQYVVKQETGSRFPGITEFRGENRSYGALITFSVNDPDLPHPDAKVERERQIAKREKERLEKGEESEAAARPDTIREEPGEKPGGPKKPMITVEVRDASGERIRTFERPLYRGINRVVWDLKADAFKSPPPNTPRSFDFEPEGPEVLPGAYAITLRTKDHEVQGQVSVVSDPRLTISAEDRRSAWETYRRAGRIRATATAAIQRILDARSDIDFVLEKIARLDRERTDKEKADSTAGIGPGGDQGKKDEGLYASLETRAREVKRGLAKLEAELRRPAEAKGIPGDLYIWSDISNVEDFIGSTWDRPSPTVLAYLTQAEARLASFLEGYNRFFQEDVQGLRADVERAALPILRTEEPLAVPGG